MPLTPPDSDDLLLFMQRSEPLTQAELDWADDALQRATDLMWLATGIDEDPDDERIGRIVETGILAMAHMLLVTGGEDRENMFSPYSSERLGSYSYSKAQSAVAEQRVTGIPEFDTAVKYFTSLADGTSTFSMTSEKVFEQPYGAEWDRIGHDPIERVFRS